MDDILSNNTKFRKCREYEDIYHTNIKVEGKVNYFIRKERKSGNIAGFNKNTHHRLTKE